MVRHAEDGRDAFEVLEPGEAWATGTGCGILTEQAYAAEREPDAWSAPELASLARRRKLMGLEA